jgi:hypothetical protein
MRVASPILLGLAVLIAAMIAGRGVLEQSATGQSVSSGKIFFSKSFPGSQPAYFAIEVDASGKANYREAADDENPVQFDLDLKDAREMFGLAEKVRFFAKPLESKLKLANMGMKTFRYQDGDIRNETKFNYSDDANARALADWFEKIAETERHRLALEKAAQFDRLGVNKALLQFEVSWDNRRIVAAEQFLPILDKIATQPNFVHIAQARAASIAERIRGGKASN